MYQNDPMKVLTGEVRLSYCNLTTPRAAKQGGEPKFSVTILIPKTDVSTKADIDAAIQAAAQEALTKVWNGARPPMLAVPIWDGDGVRKSGVPFGDECKGHWVMTASTKNKPQVVGIDNINCELAPSDIYSGMYGRVTIRFFGYSNSGNTKANTLRRCTPPHTEAAGCCWSCPCGTYTAHKEREARRRDDRGPPACLQGCKDPC